MTEPPLLTVEIALPTQGVQPLLRTITVYRSDMQHTTYADGSIPDPNLGINLDLDDVFAAA